MNERVRVDSSSSAGQMGDTSTEALMKHSRNVNVVNNSAQPSGKRDLNEKNMTAMAQESDLHRLKGVGKRGTMNVDFFPTLLKSTPLCNKM